MCGPIVESFKLIIMFIVYLATVTTAIFANVHKTFPKSDCAIENGI